MQPRLRTTNPAHPSWPPCAQRRKVTYHAGRLAASTGTRPQALPSSRGTYGMPQSRSSSVGGTDGISLSCPQDVPPQGQAALSFLDHGEQLEYSVLT